MFVWPPVLQQNVMGKGLQSEAKHKKKQTTTNNSETLNFFLETMMGLSSVARWAK